MEKPSEASASGSLKVDRGGVMLREKVLETLRNAILDFRFKPGHRLIERELCNLTGVSRTSVREALRRLEAEGLVRNLPHRGPVVADVTVEEAESIYEVREALEAIAARSFAERASDGQLAELDDALESLEAAFGSGEKRAIIADTARFYDVLLEGCGNAIVGEIIRSLQARVVFLRATSMAHPGRAPHSLAEMQEITRAIRSRDADAAAAASVHHVRRARLAALAMLRGEIS